MTERNRQKKKKDTTEFNAGRIPPQAVEVERYVLGALLLDSEAVAIALEQVEDSDMYRGSHQKIFAAMMSLYRKDEPIDLITLSSELEKLGYLEDVGGAAYLAELASLVPSSANIQYHLSIVKEKAQLRRLIHTCTEILSESFDPNAEIESVLSAAQKNIFDLLKDNKGKTFREIGGILQQTIEEAENMQELGLKSGIIGIPTGFTELDRMTSGLQKSDLVILAGRPSMGKTAFCLNLARNAALSNGSGVGIFSLEMSDTQLVQRFLCTEAQINSQKLRSGQLTEKEWNRTLRHAGNLFEAPIYIDDTAGLDILKLTSRARRMHIEKNIGMIIVDYMQLMEGPKGMDSRQQEISYISRSLKSLAKDLNVPVLALSQLSRAVEQRPDKRPMLSDLRESGAIEQDADIVMFVYREEFYLKDHDDPHFREVENTAEIIIGKHRNGPVGTVKLTFLKQFGKFTDFAADADNAPVFTQDVGF